MNMIQCSATESMKQLFSPYAVWSSKLEDEGIIGRPVVTTEHWVRIRDVYKDKQGCQWALVQWERSRARWSSWRQEMYWASKLQAKVQWGLHGDKRSKLRSPGSEGQVLYTCRQQGETRTISNHDHGNRSDNNGYKDNSDKEQGELLYWGFRDELQCNREL